jgi:microcystin-dependent protein
MSTPYIGEIRMFGGNFAPAGWTMCAGQLMPISQNDALFTLIGTTYGGDGQETFGIPDLQGRMPIHAGQGPGISQNYQLGEKAGVESVTLTAQTTPIHNHAWLCSGEFAQDAQPQNGYFAQLNTGTSYIGPADPLANMNPGMLSPIGGSQPHENMMPYLTVTFILSLFGVFPTQT